MTVITIGFLNVLSFGCVFCLVEKFPGGSFDLSPGGSPEQLIFKIIKQFAEIEPGLINLKSTTA